MGKSRRCRCRSSPVYNGYTGEYGGTGWVAGNHSHLPGEGVIEVENRGAQDTRDVDRSSAKFGFSLENATLRGVGGLDLIGSLVGVQDEDDLLVFDLQSTQAWVGELVGGEGGDQSKDDRRFSHQSLGVRRAFECVYMQ